MGISGVELDVDAMADLIDSCGIEDGGEEIVDDPDEEGLEMKCRSRMPNGSRCTGKQVNGTRVQCTDCISKQLSTGEPLPRCKANENLVVQPIEGTTRRDLIALGECMQKIFPAIMQVDPYYDDQYLIKMDDDQGKEGETITVCRSHLEAVTPSTGGTLLRLDLRLEPGLRVSILKEHTKNPKYKNKWGEIVKRVATADEQLAALQSWTDEFGFQWVDTLGSGRVTAYVHIVACHAVPLIKHHKSLGKFSNSVIESFHKLVRFFYQRTSREGGVDQKESAYAIMQKMQGLTMLKMEEREGGRDMIDALSRAATNNRADCNCASGISGAPCHWKAAAEEYRKTVKRRLHGEDV